MKKSFKIDNSIYSKDIILTAIDDFKDIAKIEYKKSEITVEGVGEIENIFNEFMNYCLGLQNELI